MKVIDIRKAIVKKVAELGIDVEYENINKVNRPCYFIDLLTYSKEWDSNYRELKTLNYDIMYFPKKKEGNNTETWEALENVDNHFEVFGNKILPVLDRRLTMADTNMHIVDTVGHYEFSISLFDQYGKPYDYELMQELEVKFKDLNLSFKSQRRE